MSLPFTTDQFLEIFRQYNTAVWPAQVALTLAALAAVVAAAAGKGGRPIGWLLAFLWTWTGLVYHAAFFARINPAARLFAVIWLAGAAAFAWNAFGRQALAFRAGERWRLVVGGALVTYGLVVYPVLGHLGGRAYPASPTFGAPCPVTIVTFGLLWLARAPVPRSLVIAPILWAAIGSLAAFSLGVREDLGLLVAGLSGVVLALPERRSRATAASAGR
jgi:hypothetical protein